MIDPFHLIEQGCYLALRFGLHVSAEVTSCLVVRDGIYCLSEDARQYHPLESVLVGEEVQDGNWQTDAANALGITPEWLHGFCDALSQDAERSDAHDYVQGFLTAEELLATRFRRLLK